MSKQRTRNFARGVASVRLGDLGDFVEGEMKKGQYETFSDMVRECIRWRFDHVPIDRKQLTRLDGLAVLLEVSPNVALKRLMDRYSDELAVKR